MLDCMTLGTELLRDYQLTWRNFHWSELPQEGIGYLYTSIPHRSSFPCHLVVTVGKMIQVLDELDN